MFRLLTYDFLEWDAATADNACRYGRRDGIFCILAGILSIVFVLEIIEISVERHENKLSRLFEAECGS